MPSKNDTFANRLNALMKDRNVTIRQVSEKLGISKSTLQDWRSGTAPTDFMAVQKLARFLSTSMSFLLVGVEEARTGDLPISVSEVFKDGGKLFDGYLKVKIERIIPRNAEGEE